MLLKILTIILFNFFFENCLCSELKEKKAREDKNTYIVQAIFSFSVVEELSKILLPQIIDIIEKETGLKSTHEIPLFFFKKRAAITVYTFLDAINSAQKEIIARFDEVKKWKKPINVSLGEKFDFFGEPKGEDGLIDLVIMVDDSQGELSKQNSKIKKLAHELNEAYKLKHKVNMYSIEKSERFKKYLPHLSLGHLRINYLKSKAGDSKAEKVKIRILEVAAQSIKKFEQKLKNIDFEKVGLYDLKRRNFVKEYLFNEKKLYGSA